MVQIYLFSQEERALQTKVNNVIMKHAPILQILNMKFKRKNASQSNSFEINCVETGYEIASIQFNLICFGGLCTCSLFI